MLAFSLWLTPGTWAPLSSAPPEDIRCGVCQKTFKRKEFLRQHMRTHAPSRDVCRCPRAGCGRTYTTAFNLQSHILSFHEEQRPFVCEYAGCGKTFAMKVSPVHPPTPGAGGCSWGLHLFCQAPRRWGGRRAGSGLSLWLQQEWFFTKLGKHQMGPCLWFSKSSSQHGWNLPETCSRPTDSEVWGMGPLICVLTNFPGDS